MWQNNPKKKKVHTMSEHHHSFVQQRNNLTGRPILPFDGMWTAGESMV